MGYMGAFTITLDYATPCFGIFMGYSWGIHGVFMGYTYVSGMYRVCIGYVSGICRKKRGARDEINDNGDNWRGNQHPAVLRGRWFG